MHETFRTRAALVDACDRITATCACSTVRFASRAITRYYDSVLTASGLRVTQFIVLVGVFRGLGTTLTKLGRALGMDRSSVSRNLRPLVRGGLVEVMPATDRRRRALRVTKAGERQLARSIPAWRQAQEHVLATVGVEKWQALGFELQSLARGVRTK